MSWIEERLTQGCGPLGHTLIAIAPEQGVAFLCCTRCDRRQASDDSTCLVCNQAGEVPVRLFRDVGDGPVAEGRLCALCADELLGRRVAGWWAEPLATGDTDRGEANGTRTH